MSINLVDFFEYFDSSIPEHLQAVQALESEMPQYLKEDTSSWVQLYRTHRKPSSDSMLLPEPKDILKGDIDWSNSNQKISRYFSVGEVTKGDPRRNPHGNLKIIANIQSLAFHLDNIRDKWGSAIGVTSWYRPAEVNRAVGGVENSMHVLGLAADIYPLNGEGLKLEAWLSKSWQGGLGYGFRSGRGFCHVDLGENRRWQY